MPKHKNWKFRLSDCEPGHTFEHWAELSPQICPICDGVYHFRPAGEDNEIYCLCATLRYLDRRYEASHIFESWCEPTLLKSLTPIPIPANEAAQDLTKLLAVIRDWMITPERWLFIQGNPGVGKSHIMCAIKTALPWMTTYISAARLQSELFSSMKDKDGVQLFIDALSLTPILLLDDLGLEHAGSFTTDSIAAVIDNRYTRRGELVTVITSNIDPSQLIGSPLLPVRRIASRIMDRAICDRYQLRQSDYRMIPRQELRKLGVL